MSIIMAVLALCKYRLVTEARALQIEEHKANIIASIMLSYPTADSFLLSEKAIMKTAAKQITIATISTLEIRSPKKQKAKIVIKNGLV